MSIDMETTDTLLVDVSSASYSYSTNDVCCDICGAQVKGFRADVFILCESCDMRLGSRNYSDFELDVDYDYIVDDVDAGGDWYW